MFYAQKPLKHVLFKYPKKKFYSMYSEFLP